MFGDYKKFKDALVQYKIESLEDLKKVLDKVENLTAQLSESKNRIEDLKSEHMREVESLKHSILLERSRMESENKKIIDVSKHKLDLQKAKFDAEKEALLLKTQQECEKIRQEFLERNYGDLKDEAGKIADRNAGVFKTILETFHSQNKQLIGYTKAEDLEVDINTK